MKPYRIRLRNGRWEILRPRGKMIGPIVATRQTLPGAMAFVCANLRHAANLDRARAI